MSIFTAEDFKKNSSTAPFFQFEREGDTIEGEVTAAMLRDGNYGEQLILTLKTDQGDRRFSSSGILRDQIEKAGGHNVGRLLGVRFNGMVTSKNGRQYKGYSVAVKVASMFDA